MSLAIARPYARWHLVSAVSDRFLPKWEVIISSRETPIRRLDCCQTKKLKFTNCEIFTQEQHGTDNTSREEFLNSETFLHATIQHTLTETRDTDTSNAFRNKAGDIARVMLISPQLLLAIEHMDYSFGSALKC